MLFIYFWTDGTGGRNFMQNFNKTVEARNLFLFSSFLVFWNFLRVIYIRAMGSRRIQFINLMFIKTKIKGKKSLSLSIFLRKRHGFHRIQRESTSMFISSSYRDQRKNSLSLSVNGSEKMKNSFWDRCSACTRWPAQYYKDIIFRDRMSDNERIGAFT